MSSSGTIGIVWFRRDLRLSDNPTLRRAVEECDKIIPLFVVDDRIWPGCSANRRWFLSGCLADVDDQLGGRLVVRRGRPDSVIAGLVRDHGVTRLYRAVDAGPAGRQRDSDVDDALAGAVESIAADQPYTVELGSLRTSSGGPFKVYTPYWRRWSEVEVDAPELRPRTITTVAGVASDGVPDAEEPTATAWRPEPGEQAGRRALDRFLRRGIDGYDVERDVPAADATSRLGPYLKFGCLHPRQILHRLDRRRRDHQTYARELAWRNFYADVLFAWPESAWEPLDERTGAIEVDRGAEADERFDAWCRGETGYPIVDAGMRQLVAEGFMHNRLRMTVASFLVKDLHLEWQRGAAFFLDHLYDGDLPSNNHGWQWAAGTGTDAAPYFRVFNPTTQGQRFDPDGEYVRRWVPELADVSSERIHEPHRGDEPVAGYPEPIVDHAAERAEALRRYQAVR